MYEFKSGNQFQKIQIQNRLWHLVEQVVSTTLFFPNPMNSGSNRWIWRLFSQFLAPLYPSPPHGPILHLRPAREPPKSPFITIAREHELLSPCRDAPYCGGSKRAARPTLRRAAPLSLSPLLPLDTPKPPRSPRSRAPARARARRAPWPTTDGADVRLSPLPPPTKRPPPQHPLTPSDHTDMPSPP